MMKNKKLVHGMAVGIAIVVLMVITIVCRVLPSLSSPAIETSEDALKLFVECYNSQNFDKFPNITGHPGEPIEKTREKFDPMFQAFGPFNNFTIQDKVVDEHSVSVLEFSADTKIGHIVMYGIFCRSHGGWSLYSFLPSKEVALKMAEPLKTLEASMPPLEEFVRKNYQEIMMDANDLSDFAIMEPMALSNSVILFGEGQHHTQELHDLFFKLVVFLSQYGYRDIVIEAPSSQTYYFNAYLKTGIEEYYRFLDDESGLWKKVYEYNKGLPEEKKIRVWCVDLDHNQVAAVSIVRVCIDGIPEGELKKEMLKRFLWDTNTYIEEFKKVLHNGSASAENTFLSCMYSDFEAIKNLFKENRSYLINQIGNEKYQETLDVIIGVIRSLEICEQKTSGSNQNPMDAMRKWREAKENEIKERFVKVYEKLPEDAKVLAYFGAWHADKMPRKAEIEEWDEIETIGHYLPSKYERTKGKVYSIMSVSYKGEYYGGLYTDEKMTLGRTSGSLEEAFANASNHDLWFLDISASKNPFAKYDYLSRSNRAWDQPQYNGMNGWVNQSKYDGFFFVREIHCVERPNWIWY